MALLYKRRITVEVAGLTVKDLRIIAQTERQIDQAQNKGEVTIYNLSPENETLIYERADEVRISAGYPSTEALIFDGFSERVRRVREDLSRQTIIKLGDSVRKAAGTSGGQPRLGGWLSGLALRGPETIRNIVQRIIDEGDMPPLAHGALDMIPSGATANNWAMSGPATVALTTILRRVMLTWFEDNGVIRINKARPPGGGAVIQSDAPTINISVDTGMIDRPIETDEGAEILMLLNPAVVPGCQLNVQSDTLNGSFKVVGMRHSADNWATGPFQTWVDLREI